MSHRTLTWLVALTLVALVAGCSKKSDPANSPSGSTSSGAGGGSGASASTGQGFETPQAAFEAFQSAMQENNWKAAAHCMTIESQETMAGGLAIVASLVAAFEPEKGATVKDVLKKHGLNPDSERPAAGSENPLRQMTAPIADKPAFIADMMDWMQKNSNPSEGGPDMSQLKNMKLESVEISGDSAKAKIVHTDGTAAEDAPIEFRQVNGRWFVHVADEGMNAESSLDFPDNQFSQSLMNMQDELPKVPLEAVTQEQFTGMWQTDLAVDQKPALATLAQLATELGLHFEPGEDLEVALNRPVSLDGKPRSRLQAIEEVCEQIGVYPQYSGDQLQFKAGSRPYPAAFAGPFLVEVEAVQEFVPYATGTLQVRIYAAGLPLHLAQYLAEAAEPDSVNVQQATDAAGNELLDENDTGGSMRPQLPAGTYNQVLEVPLRNLLRGVERVQNIEGSIQFTLPTQIAVLSFDKLAAGEHQESGEIKLKLEQADAGNLSVEYEGTDLDHIRLVAYDGQGQQVEPFSTGGFGGGGSGMISASYEQQPARLEARIVTMAEPIHFAFALSAIELREFENMPEKIEPLSFAGEQPVSLEFLRFSQDKNFPEVYFRAKNGANKDVKQLDFEMEYLDGDGKVLETFPHSHAEPGIVAPQGAETELKMPAFFRPEGATAARAVLKHVRFADATRWQATDDN